MVIILFLKLFKGPIADLLAAVFLSIVVWVLGNLKKKFVVMVYAYFILSLKSCPVLRVLFYLQNSVLSLSYL